MTSKNYTKIFKQLKGNTTKLNKFKKHNQPQKRSFGRGSKKCKRCGRKGAHISKYRLNLCRQCFRDIATKIGFKRYS
ncbi:MAG: 30S ribosomal protein S14 [Nanoarchaeota archaeon]|jgi:small subunit ribosomal protein S14|nr:30S ribosomal protein S14 [Nanoarchaeota archaeon]